ncbi:MAG: low molecular weight phosphatase family protein [Magnetovibrio sp.]|nr:low molecular weight phosphatase family protein [Magnetovibrio sp.]|tara:strand:- start:52 stop:495 length:444 start_codon:yes stop_codon:yes gene_type:complete
MIDFPSAVLFACTMNSVRSAIAEGLLKNLLGKAVYVDSAGVRPGSIDGFAVEVMNEIGIDISRHKAKTFDHLEDRSFDVIISLSIEAQHKATEISRVLACDAVFWKTFDPTIIEGNREIRLGAYRQVRDQLFIKIKKSLVSGVLTED